MGYGDRNQSLILINGAAAIRDLRAHPLMPSLCGTDNAIPQSNGWLQRSSTIPVTGRLGYTG